MTLQAPNWIAALGNSPAKNDKLLRDRKYWEGLSAYARRSAIHKSLFTSMLAVTDPDTLIASIVHASSTGTCLPPPSP